MVAVDDHLRATDEGNLTVTEPVKIFECLVWLPAKSRKKTRYMILMLQVSENFEGIAAVEIDGDSILVRLRSTQSIIKTHAKLFL